MRCACGEDVPIEPDEDGIVEHQHLKWSCKYKFKTILKLERYGEWRWTKAQRKAANGDT